MFDSITAAPPDAILGLTEAFRSDKNPEKINLTVGVYQDATGTTPILECVKKASRQLVEERTTLSYLPIPGMPQYRAAVQQLLFGTGHEIVESQRAVSFDTPGGTGALRVVGDFLHANYPDCKLYLTNPTWPNHPGIFAAAGVTTDTVPYFDAERSALDFDALRTAIQAIPSGNAVLLHGCCHNPTGVDPSPEQWQELAVAIRDRGLLPIIDFAYQGFADGIEDDAQCLHAFAQPGQEMVVCSSFSKNFGLYRERVGAATFVTSDADTASRVQSQVNRCIRANYSNPPAFGASIVTTVLSDPALRTQWEQEVADMRARINGMRRLLVEKLQANNVPGDFEFITRQRGMFSFSGLKPDQVQQLREKYSIYIVGSGRINVAGITDANIDRLAAAIADVVD